VPPFSISGILYDIKEKEAKVNGALQAVRTTSPLVQQCQKAMNDISARNAVGLYWVPGRAGVQGNEIADEFARVGSNLKFVGPEPTLGVSRQVIR
jgi:ribonuclease HI